jgi:hypothetical protein
MPIRSDLRCFYPKNWHELSCQVRFERAAGRCQTCARPHGAILRCLPDGRWFDPEQRVWRNGRGRPAAWPDLIEAIGLRTTRVVLAAAHLDHDPANNRRRNLRSLCQRCHLLHDRPYHLAQRWLTYRRRYAVGDLFLGFYHPRPPAVSVYAYLSWKPSVRKPSAASRMLVHPAYQPLLGW